MKEFQETTFEFLFATAKKAAAAILDIYGDDFDVHRKADTSPVTAADLAADQLIRDALRETFPSIPVISEESHLPDYDKRRSWSRYWLVDPLDGTREFVNRNGEFTVNIALIENQYPVAGMIYAPVQKVAWWGGKRYGATRRRDGNDTPIAVNQVSRDCPRVLVSRSHRSTATNAWLTEVGAHDAQPLGSSLKFCALAEGTADVYPRFGPTSEWDTAAGQAIVEGAGGKVTTWQGQRLAYNAKADILNGDFIAHSDNGRHWPGLG
ncbi:MAG: 3'(2'),5'-bisphosphate nucleotidase CysQ [Pseudomonadota bacterium]